MKKPLALLLGAMLWSACCVAPVPKRSTSIVIIGSPTTVSDRRSLVARLELSTVALVHFVDDAGNTVDPDAEASKRLVPYCAGVWVADDAFLTADHCVNTINRPDPTTSLQNMLEVLKSGIELEPWSPVGQRVLYSTRSDVVSTHVSLSHRAGEVMATDEATDLALIRTTTAPSGHPVINVAAEAPQDGDDVNVVGHQSGFWWTYMRGYVSAHRPRQPNAKGQPMDTLQVEVPAWYGNSGGGCFNEAGELVGITSWISLTAPSAGFFISVDPVRGFLVKNHVGGRPR